MRRRGCEYYFLYRSRRARALVAAAMATVGLDVSRAVAGTRRHDVADASYLALGNQTQFAGVGALVSDVTLGGFSGADQGTGELITDRWVLTAAHLIDVVDSGNHYTTTAVHYNVGGTDEFNGTAANGGEYFPFPTFDPFNYAAGVDIALVHLKSSISTIAPLQRFTGINESGVGTIVAYGSTGTGQTGATIPYGTKRGGNNDIDQVGAATGNNNLIGIDFDNPTGTSSSMGSATAKPLEYLATAGDSGGALFANEAGVSKIAGIVSFGSANNGIYGDTNYFTRVSSFNAWIDDQISARYWNNASGGSFSTAGNWDEGAAPGSGNIAVFNIAGTYSVSLGSSITNKRIRIRTGDVSLNLGGATYTLGSSTLESSLSVGHLQSDNASLTISNGTMALVNVGIGEGTLTTGRLTIASGAMLIASGSISVGGSSFTSGGSGQLIVNSGGSLQIQGGLTVWSNDTFTNAGSVLWSGTNSITVNAAGGVNNQAGAMFDITANGKITGNSQGTFLNQGTVRKSASAVSGTTFLSVPLTNFGTFIVNDGTLTISDGTSNGGTFNVAASRRLSVSPSSAFQFVATNLITGGGVTNFGTLVSNTGTLKIDSNAVLIATGTLNNNGTVDLNNKLILDYTGTSPISAMKTQISSGYSNAAWNGPGIRSSLAAAIAANASNLHKTAIGYAEASTLNVTSFAGQTVDATSILMRYTEWGDANLDGTVSTADFTLLAGGFNKSGQFWSSGDFDYNGKVNALDFSILATNFGQTIPSAPVLGSLVPEPSALIMLGMGALSLLHRHRRQKQM